MTLTRSAEVQQGRPTVQTDLRIVQIIQSIERLVFRGRLLGYARGQGKQSYAIVDTGREVVAFRTDDAGITAGREVRATCHRMEEHRRRLVWQLADEELERQRERGRER